jgi:hypothetical protein
MKGTDVHRVEIGEMRNALNLLVLKPAKKRHTHKIQCTKMDVEEITHENVGWSHPVQNTD